MKILIACEFSGTVRDAFTSLGHHAVSCDLIPSKTPGEHYVGNVLDILDDGWDMMIAHPPCTYLSRTGARWLFANGQLNQARYLKGLEAKSFFEKIMNAPIEHIAVENPTPMKIFQLPKHSQAIQPHQFGHPFSKRTLLWLKNLPELVPTDIKSEFVPYLPSNTGGAKRGQKATYKSISQQESSITFSGIANAMATQWGAEKK